MINLGVLLVGFILGVFAVALLVLLVALHKPRVSAPTLRRNRHKSLSEVMPSAEGTVDYRFINLTGLEGE